MQASVWAQRLAGLALGMGVTLTSAVVVLLLIRVDDADRAPNRPLRPTQAPSEIVMRWKASVMPPEVSRLSFLPPDTGLITLPPDDSSAGEGITPETEALQAWLTETQRAKPSVPNGKPAASRSDASAAIAEAAKDHTLDERLAKISPTASERIVEKFASAKAPWPPSEISLVAIKDERALELFARAEGGAWTFVHRYRVLAASGSAGPKLRRGDKQVPEGVYRISYLNPNSRYHVSMRVSYPNVFDRQMAKQDGRKDLGGDIMIHGKNLSAGCLAMGDEAAEELFVLSAKVGLRHIKVIIAPTDFRRNAVEVAQSKQPAWVPKLYTEVASAMSEFKAPPPNAGKSLLSLLGF